ncbi:glycogen synthase [Thiomicrospira aerophila AL3]|uniref:Glycogen synthase n=1 Tax=Thiomicrospira aerophila AL3 TaxID=717772 RepID=W0DTK3_9GAMM|nr:glycogen synthase GlgA [Thiomicrospira aerophila]AHF01762.1 glycogen synthase [Thiomicrospira aerophila AL3]
MAKKQRILFASSEVYPLIKTGGLADVSGGLPSALVALGHDVKVIMPAYQQVMNNLNKVSVLSQFDVGGCGRTLRVRVLQAKVSGLEAPVWLIDIPELFNRPGNPYLAADGRDWWDNGERFGVFSKAVIEVAMNRAGLNWQADVVHANDWQTGLVPALLTLETAAPRSVFTVHNMAYAGLFPKSFFDAMWLPWDWWQPDGIEFYGYMSMLKAGIRYADWVTTVSPTYAKEMCYPEFAYGLEGVLQQRSAQGRLVGILNGIDDHEWNPATDKYISYNYSAEKGRVSEKTKNKTLLLTLLGHPAPEAMAQVPLIGLVGRLVDQKGIDLVLDQLPYWLEKHNLNMVVVGTGMTHYEQALLNLSYRFPDRLFVHLGYSETLAHQVEAGADMFLMPSRFEPCGLNQMYSLAYGTPPIVHHTGGLADTVVNATAAHIADKTANGFVFYDPNPYALTAAVEHAIELYNKPKTWQQIQKTGMNRASGWQTSAQAYLNLYLQELDHGH